MKIRSFIFAGIITLAACTDQTKTEQQLKTLKELANTDSVMLIQSKQKDSTITTYLTDLNDIQNNLDAIKMREKIITVNSPEYQSGTHESIIAEIKEIDGLIIRNNKKINSLEARLKKMNIKNDTLENIIAHFTREIAERDQEIAGLQAKLSIKDDSLRILTSKFMDSVSVIRRQRDQIGTLNTVYYISGTLKELQDKGIIGKEGGFIGIGRSPELSSHANENLFSTKNMYSLHSIALNGKFRRLITTHPDNSYNITTNGTTDSLVINIPVSFWSQSKYLVIAIK